MDGLPDSGRLEELGRDKVNFEDVGRDRMGGDIVSSASDLGESEM